MRVSDALRAPRSMARPLAQFVVSGLVAVLLPGLVAVELMRRTGQEEAIRDAETTTRLAGDGIVGPSVTKELLRGDPDAIAKMDQRVRASILGGNVVRVKLWDQTGRIVYSDEQRLIGNRYEIDGEELEALHNGTQEAEISRLSG